MRDDKLNWDAECDATRAGMERFLRALVCTDSHFTDSFTLEPVTKPKRVSVFFRVWIPRGSEQRFLAMAQIDELKPPPRVDLGWTADAPQPPREPQRAKIVREATP